MTFTGNHGNSGRRATTSGASGRGRGGGISPVGAALPVVLGGGSLTTVILVMLAVWLLGGIGGGGGQQPAPQGQGQYEQQYKGNENDLAHCDQPNAINEYDDCRAEETVRSVDDVWSRVLPEQANLEYRQPGMRIFQQDVQTGCGYATAATGPFYCPRDETAYLDVTFFNELTKLGGNAGPLAQMYATSHEMGHHIQQIEGTLGLSDYKNPGEDSAAVAIELQADCYAGLWAHYAEQDGWLEPITDQQLNEAIQTAQAIGDDNIQKRSGGQVDPDAWTHGSSEQRGEAFMAGYKTGRMAACDTLNRGVYS